MKVKGEHYRTVWFKDGTVFLVDQTLLPFEFKIHESRSCVETCDAIKRMIVRGAGAIGASAGFAMAQAFLEASAQNFSDHVEGLKETIENTRPTAQNLFYAVNRVFRSAINHRDPKVASVSEAQRIADEDAENCRKIGEFGNKLIKNDSKIMTHCNAGWLAFVDYGTALSPVYEARRSGKKIFVHVGETRPRSQGARLTAWELQNENVPYCIFADNAGASIMQKEKIDMVIVGADRIARNGDVANKIGTFEKAIVARELGIPFYVAAPTSTIDLNCESGSNIPIEYRSGDELLYQTGFGKGGALETVLVYPEDFTVVNPAFDVTPSKYIAGIITEKGILKPEEVEGLLLNN